MTPTDFSTRFVAVEKILRVVSASDGRNNSTPTVACQAREETKPSFVPQFLQNSASAGLAVLQFSQIFGPCTGPVRGVSSGHGRIVFSIALHSRVRCAITEPSPPRNPQTGIVRMRKRNCYPAIDAPSRSPFSIPYTSPMTTQTIAPLSIDRPEDVNPAIAPARAGTAKKITRSIG